MLKISTLDTPAQRTLVVEGKLVEPWVDELKKSWSAAVEKLDGRCIVIDLKNVTLISSTGQETLSALMREGARFSCNGVLTRHVLKELERRCQCSVTTILKPAKANNRNKARNEGGGNALEEPHRQP